MTVIARKRKQLEEDALSPGAGPCAAKLQKHLAKEQELKQQLQVLENKDLRFDSMAHPNLNALDITVVAFASEAAEALQTFGLPAEIWKNSVEQYKLLFETTVLWYCHTHDLEKAIVLGDSDSDIQNPPFCPKVESMQMASRMLGGYIAGHSWFDLCRRENRFLRPVLKMKPLLYVPTEVCLHKSLGLDSGAVKAVVRCTEAAAQAGRRACWQVRLRWCEITRKTSHVLVSVDVDLKPLVAKAQKEGNKGQACLVSQFLAQRTRWSPVD